MWDVWGWKEREDKHITAPLSRPPSSRSPISLPQFESRETGYSCPNNICIVHHRHWEWGKITSVNCMCIPCG